MVPDTCHMGQGGDTVDPMFRTLTACATRPPTFERVVTGGSWDFLDDPTQ